MLQVADSEELYKPEALEVSSFHWEAEVAGFRVHRLGLVLPGLKPQIPEPEKLQSPTSFLPRPEAQKAQKPKTDWVLTLAL